MAKFISFTVTVTTAGTPVPLKTGTEDIRCAWAQVQNNHATGNAYLGAANVTNANGEGITMYAGGSNNTVQLGGSQVDPDPIWLSKLYVDADNDGQAVSVLALIV